MTGGFSDRSGGAYVLVNVSSLDEARALMQAKGLSGAELDRQARHRVFPGNRPSTTLAYPKLTPFVLGQIIALYEQRVFVEGVILGIRPEHLRVVDSGGWPLHVETVEMLGAERLIYGRLGGPQGTWSILRMSETEAPPAPGQALHVVPLEDRVHGFDEATGLRVES